MQTYDGALRFSNQGFCVALTHIWEITELSSFLHMQAFTKHKQAGQKIAQSAIAQFLTTSAAKSTTTRSYSMHVPPFFASLHRLLIPSRLRTQMDNLLNEYEGSDFNEVRRLVSQCGI